MPRAVYKRRDKLSKLEQGTTRLATRPDLRISAPDKRSPKKAA